jgi:hypothetical protein
MNHEWKLVQQGQRHNHKPGKALQNHGLPKLPFIFSLHR